MKRVIRKSYFRVIEQEDLPGYNKQWKPERQISKRWLAWLFISICIVVLFLGVFHQVSAKSQVTVAGKTAQTQLAGVSIANVYIEPGGVQGDYYINEMLQTGIWFGLAASLSGALIMGLSFLVLQRQKA
jgi:hypothetical protein